MTVLVTLQHLSETPTQLALTQDLGLFKGLAFPWSVSIDDLDVITRFCVFPDVLLHYNERRTAHQRCDVFLHGDELDIFGQYLDTRLHPSGYEARAEIRRHGGPKMVHFVGGEGKFAPVYAAGHFGDTASSKPAGLKLPEVIAAVLRELCTRPDNGSRWISFALLG